MDKMGGATTEKVPGPRASRNVLSDLSGRGTVNNDRGVHVHVYVKAHAPWVAEARSRHILILLQRTAPALE